MPNTREKLVELIIKSGEICYSHTAEELASHLITNGVTVQDNTEISEELLQQLRNSPITILQEEPTIEVVQEWISVKDRLPEEMRAVIVWTKDRARGEAWLAEDGFEWCESGERADVTHWMEFPQPPKGE